IIRKKVMNPETAKRFGAPAAPPACLWARIRLGINIAKKITMGIVKTRPSMKRAPKRIQNPPQPQANGDAPAPLAIIRLKNAGLQLAHTKVPAIWTKSDCPSARPHSEQYKTV